MPAECNRDSKGAYWRVPDFATKDVKKFEPIPGVDVWWNRDKAYKSKETLVLRQDIDGQVGVVILSFGQVYDLIDALNKAVEDI